MAGEDRPDPLERLLNLVGLLLETRRPLTFEEIRTTLEAYRGDNLESAKRKFERDKDVLREYGVPLELVDVDRWGTEQGYVIPKDRYYLPEIAFTPQEISALLVAARSGGGQIALERGVRKLLYGAQGGVLTGEPGGPLVAGSDADGEVVVAAAAAAQRHDRVRFGYRTAAGAAGTREVDAWAVVFRAGHWYLVGRDAGRDAVRAFRLSRVTTALERVGEGSAPPADFAPSDHVRAGPWEPGGDDRAEVAFAPDVAWHALEALEQAQEVRSLEDGWVVLSIPFHDAEALAAPLLEYGPDAEVIAPAAVREEVVRRLRELADA